MLHVQVSNSIFKTLPIKNCQQEYLLLLAIALCFNVAIFSALTKSSNQNRGTSREPFSNFIHIQHILLMNYEKVLTNKN